MRLVINSKWIVVRESFSNFKYHDFHPFAIQAKFIILYVLAQPLEIHTSNEYYLKINP